MRAVGDAPTLDAARDRMKAMAFEVWLASATDHGRNEGAAVERERFDAWWARNADALPCPGCEDSGECAACMEYACPLDCKSACGSPGWCGAV